MKQLIEIPQSLKDIHLDSFIQFVKMPQDDERLLKYKAFKLFLGMDKKLVDALNFDQSQVFMNEVSEVLTNKPSQQLTFEIDGVKYGRIPNLDTITFGEYYDLDGFITPAFEGEIKHEEAFRFMAVMYRPIIEEVQGLYKIAKYTANEDWLIMKKAPTNAYLDTVSFFLTLRSELLKHLRTYLEGEAATIPELNLAKVGAGMAASITLLKEIYSNTTKSQNSHFRKSLQNCYLINKTEN